MIKVTNLMIPPRFCRVCYCLRISFFRSINSSSDYSLTTLRNKRDAEKNDLEEKLVYNSKIKFGKGVTKRLVSNQRLEDGIEKPPLLALKYFSHNDNEPGSCKDVKVTMPYGQFDDIKFSASDESSSNNTSTSSDSSSIDLTHLKNDQNSTFSKIRDLRCLKLKKDWIKEYNKYNEISLKLSKNENGEDPNNDESVTYGTQDPNVASSNVPCGGCGATLHCQDSAIPGFIPKEIFQGLSESQLQAVVCQRCHFLREYNMALSVNVDPEIYPQLLSQIKGQTALVILVVDMTDFPCSIWPGILDIIGPKRPLVVVGNKIDLLQDTSEDWLSKAKSALVKQLPPRANILDVRLVSAKTGYGIENLITSLNHLWEYRGDVYLVGCTNVGKSTLFNTLLQSDYCKTKAVNLLHRATTAPWPGTTLNLLKFPIMKPKGWRLAMRSLRLLTESAPELEESKKENSQSTPQMISTINRTFAHGMVDMMADDYGEDPFAMPKLGILRRLKSPNSGLDANDPVFAQSKWLYDTPGVITPDQIIDLLTTEELLKTLPKEAIVPRSFSVWAGQSLLIAGLARLDYIEGPNNIKMTVLASKHLPVTICSTVDVDQVYEHYLGTKVLEVPSGSSARLNKWPGLASAPAFVLKGEGWKQSCADVVLSSAGWIAVTAIEKTMCQLQAWTPNARGIHVRVPPVLPRAIAQKGSRMYKSQAYALFNENVERKIKQGS